MGHDAVPGGQAGGSEARRDQSLLFERYKNEKGKVGCAIKLGIAVYRHVLSFDDSSMLFLTEVMAQDLARRAVMAWQPGRPAEGGPRPELDWSYEAASVSPASIPQAGRLSKMARGG